MALIPCTTGTVALYKVEGDDETVIAVPVEAWGSEDPFTAFVATRDGHLAAAHSRAGFVGLEQASAPLPRPGAPVREPVKVGPGEPRGPRGPRDPVDPRGPRPETPRGRQA
ncbi:hypothetical protein [Nonomuraea sp. GTA35]|uniref:hypothetical protein n=1 Tax=Nonomuraea sp. GTA35 TaxID=1676746 RepID=UPI0035C103BC